MCSIITTDKASITLAKLEKYLLKESSMNDDGMALILQDREGRLSSLKTFDLNTVLTLLDSTDWIRLWMHMRAATQGEVNLRNTHGWMTSDGTAVMHNGVLFDRDTYKFNVDSELIVSWLENYGIDLTLELLLNENYANVFMINNEGDYYISRTKSGSLFTDGNGNFSTNQVGRINKAVKSNYQQLFKSGFIKPVIKEILNYHDYEMTRFNDMGRLDGLNPNIEHNELTDEMKLGWDVILNNVFNDEELTEYEKFKKEVG